MTEISSGDLEILFASLSNPRKPLKPSTKLLSALKIIWEN